jgi:two-component system, NarL family, sensor histidine kinase UhpB
VMKLRTRMNLVLAGLMAALVTVLLVHGIRDARSSVREEIEAGNRVAAQVLGNLVLAYSAAGGRSAVLGMLTGLGHVRANDVTLRDASGSILYHSPPPSYKAGREAPAWFRHLLEPTPARQIFTLGDGSQVIIEAQASRAILDAWDDLTRLLAIAGVLLLVVGAITFYLVERALAPFPVIVAGLGRLQRGELAYRLPQLSGAEAHAIGTAFNRMAQAVQDNVQAEREAREARNRLEERRELALLIEQSVEEERRLIAHELHDEFGQSVTAIRSLAMAIATRASEPPMQEAAQLIADEAGRLYDAMHGLIPRLAPLSLDTQNLGESLERLVHDWQLRHPTPRLTLEHQLPEELGASATLAAYRVAQEGLTNAVRHARATHVIIAVQVERGSLLITVSDDGIGLPGEWARPGHFGLRGLKERIEHLGGTLAVGNRAPRGVCLSAQIPLGGAP